MSEELGGAHVAPEGTDEGGAAVHGAASVESEPGSAPSGLRSPDEAEAFASQAGASLPGGDGPVDDEVSEAMQASIHDALHAGSETADGMSANSGDAEAEPLPATLDEGDLDLAVNRLRSAPGLDLSDLAPEDDGTGLAVEAPHDPTAEVIAARPLVTVVLVARDPGPWFTETLEAVAAQDYGRIDVVVADCGEEGTAEAVVRSVLPDATVIRMADQPGFGTAVNRAVDSSPHSAFLMMCSDDIAPAATSVRLLVEETFRSNGAVAGPKAVDWDDPSRIVSVGATSDKFAEPSPIAIPSELDQEQHDAVRDVLVVDAGALLVRRDLFSAIGGYDEAIDRFGEAQTLCWRAHLAGGRVLTVPAAVVRRRGGRLQRHPDPNRRHREARHQLRNLLSNYGWVNLVLLLPQLLGLHLAESVRAAFRRDLGRSRDLFGAWAWNLRNLGSLRRNRALVAGFRRVGDREVRSLQIRGSNGLRAMTGSSAVTQGQVGDRGDGFTELLSDRERAGTILTVAALGAVFLLGSRSLFTDGVAAVGQFIPWEDSPSEIASRWASSWRTNGPGSDGLASPGLGLVSMAGFVGLGQVSLARTLLVVGLVPLGWLGAWRLVGERHGRRSAVVCTVAYAASAPAFDAIADGSWVTLAAHAFLPWVVRSSWASSDDDGAWALRFAGVIAFAGWWAVIPSAPVWLAAVALAGVLGASLTGHSPGRRLTEAGWIGGVAALALAPWLVQLVRSGSSAPVFGARSSAGTPSLLGIFVADAGPTALGVLAWALPFAAGAALLIVRRERLELCLDGWALVVVGWAVAGTAALGWWPVAHPPLPALLVPVALGFAVAASSAANAAEDLSAAGFSWRQPLAIGGVLMLVLSTGPMLVGAVDGRWRQPAQDHRLSLSALSSDDDERTRVLWLGDPAVLPTQSWSLTDGAAWAVTGPSPGVSQWWLPPRTTASDAIEAALVAAADGRTHRLGRVLGRLGISVVAAPSAPAPGMGAEAVRPLPDRYDRALADQLDLTLLTSSVSLRLWAVEDVEPVARWIAELEPGDAAGADDAEAAVARVVTSPSRSVWSAATSAPPDAEGLEVAVGDSDRWSAGSADLAVRTSPWSVATSGAGSAPELTHSTSWVHRLLTAVPVVVALGLLLELRRWDRAGGEEFAVLGSESATSDEGWSLDVLDELAEPSVTPESSDAASQPRDQS